MGFFDRAKDNYDKRQQIAEYNYRAKEYINEAQTIYNDAYNNLATACCDVSMKIERFISYKQSVLDEINRTLKKINENHSDLKLSLQIDIPNLECCAVSPSYKLTEFDHIIDTMTLPSVRDFVFDVSSSDVYSAKADMQRAKSYKETMRAKREELRNAKYAVKQIPNFMNDEKHKIEELMSKFKKTAEGITNDNTKERTESLCQIAELIAESLTTQFIDNNYQITDQYNNIHKRIEQVNNSLDNAKWLIGG